jgi:hypothetical protein
VRGHGVGAVQQEGGICAQSAAIDPQLDVGIEHFQKRIEVATARRGQERIDDPSLSREVAVGPRRVAQPAAGSAGELLGCRFGAVERGGNVGEWHAEHVVRHKCESLCGSERVEHRE